MFSDNLLSEMLALKGGNALSLVYGLSSRASLDLDFSLDSDFPDVTDARARLFQALRDRFDAVGFIIFDEQLEPKPRLEGEDTILGEEVRPADLAPSVSSFCCMR